MADEADQAAGIAAEETDHAVREARGRVPDPAVPGPPYCPECDEAIPEARRRLGYGTCVECAD